MTRRFCSVLALVYALFCSSLVRAQSGTVAPTPVFTGFDNAGVICAGCLLSSYIAGTTTNVATYADAALATPNANPIVLDSAGRARIFLTPGTSYKFVLRTALGATLWTADNILSVPTSASALDIIGAAGETLTGGKPVYLSGGQWFQTTASAAASATSTVIGVPTANIATGTTGVIRIGGQSTDMTDFSLPALTPGTTYYLDTTPGRITATPPATNVRRVGVANSTTTIVITGDPPNPATSAAVTSTATGTQNDFGPSLPNHTVLRLNNASLLTITGLAGGYDGQRVTLVSIGAGQVDLAHQSGSSTAANRLINIATTGPTSLAPGSGTAEYVYDGTSARWRLVRHDQGAWLAPATPTFGGNGAQTWTGVTGTASYLLSGRMLFWSFDYSGTVGGTPNTTLTITYPAGFNAGTPTQFGLYNEITDARPGLYQTNASTMIGLFTDSSAGTNWTAGTRRVMGTVVVHVQ